MSDLGPMPRLARCRLYVSWLRSDVRASPRNVCMFDVFVILACVCSYVSGFGLMSGQSRGMFNLYVMFLCFGLRSNCRGKPEECLAYMLCLYVLGFGLMSRQARWIFICLCYVFMFICLCFVLMICCMYDGASPMPCEARCQTRSNAGQEPNAR